jgi:hypothetical protein
MAVLADQGAPSPLVCCPAGFLAKLAQNPAPRDSPPRFIKRSLVLANFAQIQRPLLLRSPLGRQRFGEAEIAKARLAEFWVDGRER